MKPEPTIPTCRFCKHWDGLYCGLAVEDDSPFFAVRMDLEPVKIVTVSTFGCNQWREK